jgi:YggT family protein
VLGQIATFLIDTVVAFFVILLLARFHLQWLRVGFRNPIGEFVIAVTGWLVRPARRVIPGLGGLDLATLLTAWVLQALGLWLQLSIVGSAVGGAGIVAVALVDLLRYSVYILMFALIMQAVLSWVNPYAPVAPVFETLTRPFLRPLRRVIPPVGRFDLTLLVLIVLLQVLLIPVGYLRAAAAGLG